VYGPGVFFGVALTAAALELVRRRKLREEQSALWIAGGLGLAALASSPALRGRLGGWLGLPPRDAVLLAAFGFLAVAVLDLAVRISRIVERQKILAQAIAAAETRPERDEA
jgi:hypothetical protein